MSLSDFLASTELVDSIAIRDAFNALPSNHVAVPAASVAAWLGESGILRRLQSFAGEEVPPGLPAEQKALYEQAQSGVDAMFLTISAQDAALLLDPSRNERKLLEGLVQLSQITREEADSLLIRARPVGWVDVTEADVTAERETIAVRDARQSATSQIETAANARLNTLALDAIEAWRDAVLSAIES
ncbi:MAG: hypothetical protein AAGE65_09550 [Planctomycetota bacterium]